ncbi:dTDP-glucose 4,6-dehydratase [Sphingomonas carotinifaciens]|uniref:dTDP-glucose 4,6-dehydratase n=1 Tax=Sphingomonas carotinifaciens TaxID=1166323 RepID=A0A1G7QR02_9SPHN|nr:dTDP-glucose 4,6-dehydratase [Sphingomonas carotinifaciens]MWC42316.1 dTDP-glucose 4,6-dehydratase [Sphingomonas carotinifaciens]SDG00955.1 dTDP-glucose 4,6-dehydratase [Sphingomonas carotinifaciens]
MTVLRILITGGAGFIGSALARHLINHSEHQVMVLDALTYAGSITTLAEVKDHPRFAFRHVDICDGHAVEQAFADFRPSWVSHLAAESHVDRSLDAPDAFIQTNLIGTYEMLKAARSYWSRLPADARTTFRFHHISTDEVFGSLGDTGRFDEHTAYDPRSPYSASKAGSDHLVSAWGHSYGLPTLITNCSNNYGPWQFPEKLIPLMIGKALSNQSLPVYGEGLQVRDWLHVEDHVRALVQVLERGQPGRRYAIGGEAERRNIDVVHALCGILDRLAPRSDGRPHDSGIVNVADRPGHDQRYAIDPARIRRELGWSPQHSFETGLEATVQWYLDHRDWWHALNAAYQAGTRRGLLSGS